VDNANNTYEFVSHIRVLNHVFVMNVAMIQPRNGYRQYYFAMDDTFFEVNLTRPRPGRGQMLDAEAEANVSFEATLASSP